MSTPLTLEMLQGDWLLAFDHPPARYRCVIAGDRVDFAHWPTGRVLLGAGSAIIEIDDAISITLHPDDGNALHATYVEGEMVERATLKQLHSGLPALRPG